MPPFSQNLNASCVSVQARGVLLLGKSGGGKSDMALRLIDRGASLVADDQVMLENDAGVLIANAPASIKGLLEIRDLGIFRFKEVKNTPVCLVVQLGERGAAERLPYPEFYECMGIKIPQIRLYPFDDSAPIKVEMSVASLYDRSMMVGALKE